MSLEERVATLETENSSLKSIIETLTKRLDALENGGKAGKSSARPKTSHVRRGSGSTSGSTAAPPTSATSSAASKRPKTTTKRRSSSANVAKPLQARTKEEKDDGAEAIPENRKGSYNVGNRNIHYVLPTEFAKGDDGHQTREVKDELTLDYVYGYNGKNAYNNLFYGKEDGKIVYCIAGTAVVSTPASKTQKFFVGHNEDILCLAVHPSQPIVATGQLDPKGKGTPYICIWNESNCELVRKITFHDRGVCALAFSPDGRYLVSIGNDDSHTLAIWNWEEEKAKKGKNEPIVDQMCSKAPVYGITFNKISHDSDESKGRYEFVTTGEKMLKVWTASALDNKEKKNRVLTSRMPSTYSKSKIVVKHFNGVACLKDNVFVVGTEAGHLYKVKDTDLLKFWQAHEGAVGAVCSAGENFASVGEDGKVRLWSEECKEVASFDLVALTGRTKAECHGQSLDYKNGKLLVGLVSNSIVEIDTSSSSVTEIISGHSDEVWALAIHPTQPFAVTGAHDKTLRVWNYHTKEQVKEKILPLKSNVRSAAFSDDGKYLAIGQWTGKVALVEFDSWNIVWNNKIGKETVDSLSFSGDGTLLACGSWDQFIHVINIPDGKPKCVCKGHTSSILMLNFSADSKYIMSNSRDYEILFWNANDGKRINKSEVADTKWTHWNCFLGWSVQGIWEGAGDGTDINCVDRSKDEHSLAVGDDFGTVRLYTYPSLTPNSPSKTYPGHSSFVTCVRFTPSGDYLFSTGGIDFGVFQWRHTS